MSTKEVYRFDAVNHRHYLNNKIAPGVSTIAKIGSDANPLIYWNGKMVVSCLGENTVFKDGKPLFHHPETGEDLLLNENNFSTILKYAKSAGAREKDAAGGRGTRVHDAIHMYWLNDKYSVEPDIQKSFDAFLEWKDRYKARPLFTERTVYSLKHRYAGIFDLGCILNIPGKGELTYLIDYKTSKSVYPNHMIQSAGYKIADKELYGMEWDALGILSIHPETGYPLFLDLLGHHEVLEHAFMRCLDLYKAMRDVNKVHRTYKKQLDEALALLEQGGKK